MLNSPPLTTSLPTELASVGTPNVSGRINNPGEYGFVGIRSELLGVQDKSVEIKGEESPHGIYSHV